MAKSPNTFTISAWFYRKSNSTEDDIFTKWTAFFTGYGLWLPPSGVPGNGQGTNCVEFNLKDGSSNNIIVQSPVSSFSQNTWVHVVAPYNGSSVARGVKIYLNGVSQTITIGQDGALNSILNNNNPLIGIDVTNGGIDSMDGLIDDVRIYNRVLSADEIKRLYNTGR